jgi:hypothetical protein
MVNGMNGHHAISDCENLSLSHIFVVLDEEFVQPIVVVLDDIFAQVLVIVAIAIVHDLLWYMTWF